MYLHRLHVENYRGLHHADVTFDNTTVLIGENDSGKSSLLDGLIVALGVETQTPPTFQPWQFYQNFRSGKPAGPILIELFFKEREPNEWAGTAFAPLAPLLPKENTPRNQSDLRELVFRVKALPEPEKAASSTWHLQLVGTPETHDDPALVAWLRQLNPIIHLPSGMLTGHGEKQFPTWVEPEHTAAISGDMKTLTTRILESAAGLLGDRVINRQRELEVGFQSVCQLIGYTAETGGLKHRSLARKISEILTQEATVSAQLAPDLATDLATDDMQQALSCACSSSTSQKLAMVLLVAALIRTHAGILSDEMEPIWIIEDPEAHLHPMTRASIGRLIDDIQWQKIITTYSGSLLGGMPLSSLRRLTLSGGVMHEHRIDMDEMSAVDLRRLGYHLGLHSRTAWFARVWLLVEGESEMWLLPQLARLMGYDFGAEGIHCIEFAQSGLGSLVKAAQQLGIEWHVLTDGDRAGKAYVKKVKQVAYKTPDLAETQPARWTMLSEPDIEHCFWQNGYADIFQKQAQVPSHLNTKIKPGRMIKLAINRHSKPDMALKIVEAVATPDSPGMPGVIKNLIEACIFLARRTAVRAKVK